MPPNRTNPFAPSQRDDSRQRCSAPSILTCCSALPTAASETLGCYEKPSHRAARLVLASQSIPPQRTAQKHRAHQPLLEKLGDQIKIRGELPMTETGSKHESLGNRGSGIPDADGSWSRVCVECLSHSPRQTVSLVDLGCYSDLYNLHLCPWHCRLLWRPLAEQERPPRCRPYGRVSLWPWRIPGQLLCRQALVAVP